MRKLAGADVVHIGAKQYQLERGLAYETRLP
jgi:hypothetical protein